MCLAFCAVAAALGSCDDDETYADQKEKERKAIAGFLNRNLILLFTTVISLSQILLWIWKNGQLLPATSTQASLNTGMR